MAVQIALEILQLDELRQRAVGRSLDLSLVLAQLGRNPRKAEALVDVGLLRAWLGLAAVDRREAVLGQAQALVAGALAQRHVVRLRAGEVLQQRAPLRRVDHAQVYLHAVVQHDRRLGVAECDHVLHARVPGEALEQRAWVVRRRHEVDVADDLLAATQRAGNLGLATARLGAQRLDQHLRTIERVVEQDHVLARTAAGVERVEDRLLLLRAESLQLAQLARLARGLERVGRVDAELGVETLGGFRANARHAHHLDEAVRVLLAQLLERLQRAGLAVLIDLGRDRRADAGQVGETPLLRHALNRLGRGAELVGSAAIRDHLVDDRAVELRQARQEVEEVGDLAVLHRHDRLRCCMPATSHMRRTCRPCGALLLRNVRHDPFG